MASKRFTATHINDRGFPPRVLLASAGNHFKPGKPLGYINPDEADALADEIKDAASKAREAMKGVDSAR
jgi:hypothetical protein